MHARSLQIFHSPGKIQQIFSCRVGYNSKRPFDSQQFTLRHSSRHFVVQQNPCGLHLPGQRQSLLFPRIQRIKASRDAVWFCYG